MTEKTVLKSENGVTLAKTELRDHGAVVSRGFTVSIKGEPGMKEFPAEQAAQDYYTAEVKRRSGG